MIFVLLQQLLPQHRLSRLVGRLADSRRPWLKRLLISGFLRLYPIDMTEAAEPDPQAYSSFNALFTRSLRPGCRPMPASPLAVASPVDGYVNRLGEIQQGQIVQAKGHSYSVAALLGNTVDAARYAGGRIATLYLAPHNYHRIHMPADGTLQRMTFIPGRLHTVNARAVRALPGLFARNERVVCQFTGPSGPFAMVLVGALNVGSIETTWAGVVAPGSTRRQFDYADTEDAPAFRRGEEMGRFNLGSTVIVLFPADSVEWSGAFGPGDAVRVGADLGRLLRAEAVGQRAAE